MTRAKIWCEVTCGNCTALAGASGFYRNADTIRRLKATTKDRKDDKQYGTLCPKCYQKLRGKKE